MQHVRVYICVRLQLPSTYIASNSYNNHIETLHMCWLTFAGGASFDCSADVANSCRMHLVDSPPKFTASFPTIASPFSAHHTCNILHVAHKHTVSNKWTCVYVCVCTSVCRTSHACQQLWQACRKLLNRRAGKWKAGGVRGKKFDKSSKLTSDEMLALPLCDWQLINCRCQSYKQFIALLRLRVYL